MTDATCNIQDCATRHYARGLCQPHYQAARRAKRLPPGDHLTRTLEERFWAKVRLDEDGCWEWTAHRDRKGYGALGRGGAVVKAHRLSWELHNGPIPIGMAVCHACDNPPCVRPDHLFLGTIGDNNRDMQLKGRASGGTRGEQQHLSVLTADDVREIRARAAAGEPHRSIGATYGVVKSTISKIVTGKNWRHVI